MNPQTVNTAKRFSMLLLAVAVIGSGCATSSTSSTRAQALKTKSGATVDLSKYRTATVLPFTPSSAGKVDGSVGAKFADGVAVRLQHDFGQLFEEVRKSSPAGKPDELIVTGVIRDYDAGSKFGRAMLAGVGAASFKGDLILKDAATGQVLLSAPFDKLWAWGGWLGATKGIEDMVAESEAAVANTIAQAKGWRPSQSSKTSTGSPNK